MINKELIYNNRSFLKRNTYDLLLPFSGSLMVWYGDKSDIDKNKIYVLESFDAHSHIRFLACPEDSIRIRFKTQFCFNVECVKLPYFQDDLQNMFKYRMIK